MSRTAPIDPDPSRPNEVLPGTTAGHRPQRVAVVGGGITGMIAARQLAGSGAQVTLYESGPTLGGQLAAATVAGRQVDVGAESLFTAAPGPLELIEELGLGDRVVAADRATTWIWTERGLQPLPEGFTPAGPTRLRPLLRSRVLSTSGTLRAAMEPLVPRTATDEDVAVGHYLDHRFGRQVTDRLLDPLLGGLHAGDVRTLSLRAATPQLATLATRHRSLLLRRRPPARPGPAFVTLRIGLHSLADHLAATLSDVEVHLATRVTDLRRDDGRTQLSFQNGDTRTYDGVLLATPAHAAAAMVAGSSQAAAEQLRRLRSASVAVAALAYPMSAAATPTIARGSGLLVPSHRGRLLKAATFLSTKWPHHRDGEVVLIRASAGRADDDRASHLDDASLVARLHLELREATGLAVDPIDAAVQRWPSTLPQLEVGHHVRLAAITAALAYDLPGVTVAGAPYDGPGVAACLRSASQAVARLTADRAESRP